MSCSSDGVPPLTKCRAVALWKDCLGQNFSDWSSRWYTCPKEGLPRILCCEDCFNRFIVEYSVHRNDGAASAFQRLTKAFSERSHETPTREWLDEKAQENGPGKTPDRRSIFSKVAAFGWPEHFLPWDGFVGKGARRLIGSKPAWLTGKKFSLSTLNTYYEFAFLLRDTYDKELNEAFDEIDKAQKYNKTVFKNRVVDSYLMAIGGFKSQEIDRFGFPIIRRPQNRKPGLGEHEDVECLAVRHKQVLD